MMSLVEHRPANRLCGPRVSFGTAFNLLGGEVRETTGMANSALAKGESLYDTARVLSGYSDIIAMRHPAAGSVAEFAQGSRVPVLNGGDGANEHPSQALLDLYTIRSELEGRESGLDGCPALFATIACKLVLQRQTNILGRIYLADKAIVENEDRLLKRFNHSHHDLGLVPC